VRLKKIDGSNCHERPTICEIPLHFKWREGRKEEAIIIAKWRGNNVAISQTRRKGTRPILFNFRIENRRGKENNSPIGHPELYASGKHKLPLTQGEGIRPYLTITSIGTNEKERKVGESERFKSRENHS